METRKRVTTCVQYFRLSKQFGKFKVSHEQVPGNLLFCSAIDTGVQPHDSPLTGLKIIIDLSEAETAGFHITSWKAAWAKAKN
jgi:hypothetical protein